MPNNFQVTVKLLSEQKLFLTTLPVAPLYETLCACLFEAVFLKISFKLPFFSYFAALSILQVELRLLSSNPLF